MRRRVVTWLATATVAVVALVLITGWDEIACRYHLARLRSAAQNGSWGAVFHEIGQDPLGAPSRRALRRYADEDVGWPAMLREIRKEVAYETPPNLLSRPGRPAPYLFFLWEKPGANRRMFLCRTDRASSPRRTSWTESGPPSGGLPTLLDLLVEWLTESSEHAAEGFVLIPTSEVPGLVLSFPADIDVDDLAPYAIRCR